MIGLKKIKELRKNHVFDFEVAISESSETEYVVTPRTNKNPVVVHKQGSTFNGSNKISLNDVIDELINVIEYSINS